MAVLPRTCVPGSNGSIPYTREFIPVSLELWQLNDKSLERGVINSRVGLHALYFHILGQQAVEVLAMTFQYSAMQIWIWNFARYIMRFFHTNSTYLLYLACLAFLKRGSYFVQSSAIINQYFSLMNLPINNVTTLTMGN